jgi:2-polyprenyl-6-methoxyphenol hydroxylase-like FAD-dependent oxidoreductase
MFDDMKPEVLVVGAGPVGLFTALSLARQNVSVRIIDTGVWACTHSYALAVHPAALTLFDELGLKDKLLKDSYPVRGVAFYDQKERRAAVPVTGPGECLAVVRQDNLENLLENELEKLGVKVSWRHEAAAVQSGDDHASVTVRKFEKESRGYIVAHTEWVVAKSFELEPRFVVGADGYNSTVRRALNPDFPAIAPAQYYAVFEFKSNADPQNEVRVAVGDHTTDVLWPLPGGNCRWSFELPNFGDPDVDLRNESLRQAGFGDFPSERSKDRVQMSRGETAPVLDENNLRALLANRAPWFHGSIDKLAWRIVVRFEHRLATRYGHGPLWLAGDSAHLTGPAAIHSMNLGLFEAQDLSSTLASVLRGGADPSILSGYNDRWMPAWRQLHGLENVLQPAAGADPWVAAHASQIAACLPAYGPALSAMAAPLGLE